MRFGFLLKVAVVVTLVALFDRLFPYSFSSARIGAFAGAWLIGLVLGRRDFRRSQRVRFALATAALFAVSLFDDPGGSPGCCSGARCPSPRCCPNLMGWTPPDGIDVPEWRC